MFRVWHITSVIGMRNDNVVAVSSREYDFSQHEFARIQKLIYEYAGISLSSTKQNMVYSRLARRLRAHGLTSFNEYLSLLEKGDEAEWEAFANSLTTNLTAFFREAHHFPILEQHVLQSWSHRKHGENNVPVLQRYALKRNNQKMLHLWCSAASTGEEAYSMAMAMVKVFKTFTPPVHILATDLDTNVLAKARLGVYSMDRLEKLPEDMLKKFFLKGKGPNAGSARVRQELLDMVTFRQLNLLDNSWPIRGPFEAIFCRNVMIYFDKSTQYKILNKFSPLLSRDGLLFTGHSENLQHAANLFKLRAKTVYELANRQKV
jgi:chemotaxis protein methyltransferase CheR